MMKKISIITALLLLGATAQLQNKTTSCNISALKKGLNSLMGTYMYSTSEITHFTFDGSKKEKTIVVPLFQGQQYKLLFNTSAIPGGLKIKIYNESASSNSKKLVYTNKDALAAGERIFSYMPNGGNMLLIKYTSTNEATTGSTGCAVFVMGYKM